MFAGPNGSGKSTIIQRVRDYRVSGVPVDFGIYINADDIASRLRKEVLLFSSYSVRIREADFLNHVRESGLLQPAFPEDALRQAISLVGNGMVLHDRSQADRVAQMVADYLRSVLLERHKKFSFETVFSHTSKIGFMKQAAREGYKVYFYFVSTESPEINKDRVALRVRKGGHDVPEHLIESRYYRSLDNLYEAAQHAYQAFFFDNSGDEPILFAHFKVGRKGKQWDIPDQRQVPNWFLKYYSEKV